MLELNATLSYRAPSQGNAMLHLNCENYQKRQKTKLVERLLRKILNNKGHVQGTLKFSSLVIIRFL